MAFHLVRENAFAAVFVLAAGLCLVAAVVVAIIPARPLRADSGRL
jgi:hypothetical protein